MLRAGARSLVAQVLSGMDDIDTSDTGRVALRCLATIIRSHKVSL